MGRTHDVAETGDVAERPDAMLDELRARVAAELGMSVSVGCLWNTLSAMRLSLKSSR